MGPVMLRRRPFGYRTKDVMRLLADREELFAQANGRARLAEERLRSEQDELAKAREELARKDRLTAQLAERVGDLDGHLRDVQEELEAMRRDPFPGVAEDDVVLRFLLSGLGPVLHAAERSAVDMLNQATDSTRQHIEEAERVRSQIEAEYARVHQWQDRLTPVLHTVRDRLEETRSRIVEIPERIRDALAPVAEMMLTVGAELVRLDAVTELPDVPTLEEPDRNADPPTEGQPDGADLAPADQVVMLGERGPDRTGDDGEAQRPAADPPADALDDSAQAWPVASAW